MLQKISKNMGEVHFPFLPKHPPSHLEGRGGLLSAGKELAKPLLSTAVKSAKPILKNIKKKTINAAKKRGSKIIKRLKSLAIRKGRKTIRNAKTLALTKANEQLKKITTKSPTISSLLKTSTTVPKSKSISKQKKKKPISRKGKKISSSIAKLANMSADLQKINNLKIDNIRKRRLRRRAKFGLETRGGINY